VMGMTPCLLCWVPAHLHVSAGAHLGMAAFAEDRRGAVYALPLGGTAMAYITRLGGRRDTRVVGALAAQDPRAANSAGHGASDSLAVGT
jgi:disulfide bond formation protein DsbB